MKKLGIIGAGGHGKVVADAAELAGWDSVVFFDDTWPDRHSNQAWPIVGNLKMLLMDWSNFDGIIVAIGDNSRRLLWTKKLITQQAPLVSIVHPASTVSRYAKLGSGVVVYAGAIINPGANIGLATIINTGASVDHDCHLGESVHISPGAHLAGGVVVGDCSWIGIGASVRQNIVIGPYVTVGAGAAVVSDIRNGITVIGVPAIER